MSVRTPLFDTKGFTLPELCMTVALIGVLAQFGAMALRGQTSRHRLDGDAKQVTWDLMRARTQAIRQKRLVEVTVLSDHTYAIWTDANDDDVVDDGEEETKALRGYKEGVRFLEPYPDPVTFLPQGTTATESTLSMKGSSGLRTITVHLSGKVKMQSGGSQAET